MDISTSSLAIRQFLETISKTGIAWIVAPWDSADDEFLTCANISSNRLSNTYKIDASNYTNHEDFIGVLDGRAGCSATTLCHLLKNQTLPVLIIDNIPVLNQSGGNVKLEELHNIARIFRDYCPELWIILRTRNTTPSSSLKPITLRNLDEPESNRYILAHPDGRNLSDNDLATNFIFETSNGSPKAIDRILEKLRFMPITELINAGSELTIQSLANHAIPMELSATVDLWLSRQDEESKRTCALLKSLTILTFGEELSNIKRFHQDAPFYPKHVSNLLSSGLIEVLESSSLFTEEDKPKVLLARGIVQEYMNSKCSSTELKNLLAVAISHYFGKSWSLGKPRLNTHVKLDKHNASTHSIQNINFLIKRLLGDAFETEDTKFKQDALRLMAFYAGKLYNDHHYRLIVDLCYSLAQYLKQDGESFVLDILRIYGTSLRMLNEPERAIDIFYHIIRNTSSKSHIAEANLGLAYCYQSLKESEKCVSAAEIARDYRKDSSISFQAESIIYLNLPVEKMLPKLKKLKKACEDEGHKLVANTIALRLTQHIDDMDKKVDTYAHLVVKTAQDKDTYNHVRAIINHADFSTRQGTPLSNEELKNLVLAYHYAVTQRMLSLFKRGHRSLWIELMRLNKHDVLFHLYKQSSLIYRLNTDTKSEKHYLELLIGCTKGLSSVLITEQDKDFLALRMQELGIPSLESKTPLRSIS
ncbi:tetratricopeptide repeat protein [Pseudomonas protegens]|uniref:tetratricopeptide repeat protein n=1 Tax=Pseudomonas protegens TaxID=380021 RepID=UPI0010109BDB|nr:hypothetical protein [Pseudomonas protegens]